MEEAIVEEKSLRNRIKEAQKKDKKVVKTVEKMKRVRVKVLKDKE